MAGRPTGRPFLASVNFLANHIPVQAPDGYIARYSATAYQRRLDRDRVPRAATARRRLGIVPAGTPMVTMSTTPGLE